MVSSSDVDVNGDDSDDDNDDDDDDGGGDYGDYGDDDADAASDSHRLHIVTIHPSLLSIHSLQLTIDCGWPIEEVGISMRCFPCLTASLALIIAIHRLCHVRSRYTSVPGNHHRSSDRYL